MSKGRPLLSIVTPSYNQGEFIEDTLRSVSEQNIVDVEHIVIDGDSDDNTVEVLKQYETEYNLRWISEPDEGQSEAINKGISMAEGHFIGWINADDYYYSNAFKIFSEGLDRCPDADIVYGDFMFVDMQKQEIEPKYHTRPSRFIHKYWQNYTANHCTFIRQSVLEKVGGVNEELEYVMDAELFWRILNEDFCHVHQPNIIAARRLHEDAKTVGETTARNKAEKEYLEQIYAFGAAESFLPDITLKYIAVALQTIFFIQEARWGALRYLAERGLNKL